jgi:Tol biopolymer transport system component
MQKSYLEILNISQPKRRQIVHTFEEHIEAPNWTPDGKWLIYNSKGRLFRISPEGGTPMPIDTGFAVRCNNDHGVSPDGKSIAISDQTHEDGSSRIYTLPISGGKPKLITPNAPSFWHGWSPDGKTLAYCAQRNLRYGIYTIPAAGGEETRLTVSDGLDDGPEYSPDGKYIYFNSDRSGIMQIWRMKPNGSDLTQITNDDFGNWFPHISPDGKWMVNLSYDKSVIGHPPNEEVQLRLRDMKTGSIRPLISLFGGQGTINVPSWSPDSTKFAFVSYERPSAD